MPQTLKSTVRERIEGAAAEAFAAHGYLRASMAKIAQDAGISTGNLYRYFPNKETLFHAVVDEDLAEALRSLLHRRVRALRGKPDVRRLPASDPYHEASRELLDFCIANRLRVVALLAGNRGTRYEGFENLLIDDLMRLAIDHFRDVDSQPALDAEFRFTLERVYRGFLDTQIAILRSSADERRIRAAVADFGRYHLVGLDALFGAGGGEASEDTG